MEKLDSFSFFIENLNNVSKTYDVDFTYGEPSEEIDKQEVKDFLIDIKNKYENGFNVDEIKEISKKELGSYLYNKLNLKSFFKALKTKQNKSDEESLLYFDSYMMTLNRRFKEMDDDIKDYDIKGKFKKVTELKKKRKNLINKNVFEEESNVLYVELQKAIEWIRNNNKRVLITFDGRDTGGKGSISRFILKNYFATPWGRSIIYKDWGIPTKWQSRSANWFHRYIKQFPDDGKLALFDRSWYNRAVNDPVNGYCTEEQYRRFMEDVVPFESSLIDDGIIYIKFWLSIEKETQKLRLDLRQADPIKYWKYSPTDAKAQDKWEIATKYKEQMFARTSTKKSPWVVVDMNDKRLGQLNALRYILNKLPYDNKDESVLKVWPEIVYEI